MLKCPACGSRKFTKESNYLICEYCGSNCKTDIPAKKSSFSKFYIVLFLMLLIVLVAFNNKENKIENVVRSKTDKFTTEPKIDIVNDNSAIDIQVVQVSDKLKQLKINNHNSTIQTQVIQTKEQLKINKQIDNPKAVLLSTEHKVYNSKGEILSNSKIIHNQPKDNYVDENGIAHRTVYTKLPQININNEHMKINNKGIAIEKQNVTFSIDDNGSKYYRVKTRLD